MKKLSLTKLAENEMKRDELRNIVAGTGPCGCVCSCTCQADLRDAASSDRGSVRGTVNSSYDPGIWDDLYGLMEGMTRAGEIAACFANRFLGAALAIF